MTALARLFSESFRAFFLLAALWATGAMALWLWWLWQNQFGAGVDLPTALAPSQWHAHELIFGFGMAATAGFFLTAAPNWTGKPVAGRFFIAAMAGLWAVGRGAVLLWGWVPPLLAAGLVLAFLALLTERMARQLIRRPASQEGLYLALLALMTLSEARVLLEWLGLPGGEATAGLRGGLAALVALIVALGGKITPQFTRNALTRAGAGTEALPRTFAVLDRGATAAACLAAISASLALSDTLTGAAQLALGAVQLLRMGFWRSRTVVRNPLLAALHLAMLGTGIGALLQGAAAFGWGEEIGALHVGAIAGVGGMILAVMSRAPLAQTGRPLVAPRPVALAYALLPLAALARWSAATFAEAYGPGAVAAATLWCLAFALFALSYAPAFWGPRKTP
ncbi:uncharacterized protein involved in response to NO [Rhodobacter viridis]|uniref:Uncharacterized protein involved in response to NO n=1 Tax=Rhodobacter viridis TaxID=1054202 RepID=A0A318TYA9_9RHOB|nr:NnrS family protein [Rhodobacter viridis]PYF08727.1 uncharacterized protein involved in response to NO [Rhodobacter viridis]